MADLATGQSGIVASRTIRGMSASPESAPVPPAPAQPTHLVLPFSCTGGDGDPPLAPLPDAAQLPHLRKLLARTRWQRLFTVPLDSLTPPHEWALAHARGLPTGCTQVEAPPALAGAQTSLSGQPSVALPAKQALPWAAWDAAHLLPTPQTPAAWFTPCHQEIGAHHVSLLPPGQLRLSEAHSRALLAALAPLALEDGIHLRWVAPDRWLATGNVLGGVHAASLDRVAGRSIGPWLLALPPMLRRLQSEAQMLFYTQAAHDQRVASGQAPVNAFWVSGSGHAPARSLTSQLADNTALPQADNVTVVTSLREAALAGNAAGWEQAWRDIDQQVLSAWLARATAGDTLHIHLCGEQGWLHLCLSPTPVWQRVTQHISSFFGTRRSFDSITSL
jgi:hypothetical protein